MKCLNSNECVEWVRAHLPQGGTLNFDVGRPRLPLFGFRNVEYKMPDDSGSKVHLARLAVQRFESEAEILIWVQNSKVWPSSSHLPLMIRFRQALGENRPLQDYPGHCFTSDEMPDAVSVAVMALEFFWDTLIIAESGRCAFYISHDEYYSFMSNDERSIDEFRSSIENGV